MFDINKIKKAATTLGIDVSFGSANPGMHFHMPDGTVDVFSYQDLQKSLQDEFMIHDSKTMIQYNLETENSFNVDIHAQEVLDTPILINQIEISILGQNKISQKNEQHFNDPQLIVGYSSSEAS